MPGEGAQKAKRGEWIGYFFLFLLPFPPLSALALLVCGSSYNELIYSHIPSPYVPNKLEQEVRIKEKGKKGQVFNPNVCRAKVGGKKTSGSR